jgi:hypothetical protein
MTKYVTRSGVYHVLEESIHRLEVFYKSPVKDEGSYKIEYVFSSELYKDIFMKKQYENRVKINESVSKRFGFTIVNNLLCDLKLYMQTEKRGFLIISNDRNITCLDNLKLDGVNLIYKN